MSAFYPPPQGPAEEFVDAEIGSRNLYGAISPAEFQHLAGLAESGAFDEVKALLDGKATELNQTVAIWQEVWQ
jgi:hypothetical protein